MLQRALILSVLLASVARADVLSVGPAGAFSDLQTAVDAAADGDLLLVQTGDYGPVSIGDVSLTVTADRDARVRVHGGLTVRGLSSGRQVVIVGLTVRMDTPGPARPALVLQACRGALRLTDCELRPDGGSQGTPQVGAEISDCADVSLARTVIRALDGTALQLNPLFGVEQPPALHVRDSFVVLNDCSVRGYDACGVRCAPSLAGGPGVLVSSGRLHLGGGSVQGGRGGQGQSDCASVTAGAPGGPGGVGLRLAGDGALVILRGAEVLGGHGGAGGAVAPRTGCVATADGPAGAAIDQQAGLLVPVDGRPTSLSLSTPLREGQPLSLTWTGTPGALVGVLWSLDPAQRFVVGLEGPLLFDLREPSQLLVAGRLPPGGARTLVVPLNPLSPGWENLTVQFQALALGSQGLEVGAPASLSLVDASR